MSNSDRLLVILSKYRRVIVLSTTVIALALYVLPIDHAFNAPGIEAKSGGDNKYGRHEFGAPPGHGGNNPGNEGGSPPGKTPGGSDVPPGLQDNPGKNNPGNDGSSTTNHERQGNSDSGSDNANHETASHKVSRAND
jgi:hypothetical protein